MSWLSCSGQSTCQGTSQTMISKIESHTNRHAALGIRMLWHTLPQDQLKNLFLQDFMHLSWE